MKAWRNFKGGLWQEKIDVRDFIQANYKPYEGDESFLEGATERTKKLLKDFQELLKIENEKGVVDLETSTFIITTYGPAYLNGKRSNCWTPNR